MAKLEFQAKQWTLVGGVPPERPLGTVACISGSCDACQVQWKLWGA